MRDETTEPQQFCEEAIVSRSHALVNVGGLWLRTLILGGVNPGQMLLSSCREFWEDVLIYFKGSLFCRTGVNVLWRT